MSSSGAQQRCEELICLLIMEYKQDQKKIEQKKKEGRLGSDLRYQNLQHIAQVKKTNELHAILAWPWIFDLQAFIISGFDLQAFIISGFIHNGQFEANDGALHRN